MLFYILDNVSLTTASYFSNIYHRASLLQDSSLGAAPTSEILTAAILVPLKKFCGLHLRDGIPGFT
jgi:hypothetical protein